MIWTLHRQQQQCGAQLHARSAKGRPPGEAPKVAIADREAQDHEQAGGQPQPGESPASGIEHRDQDNTPSAPGDPRVEWDDVIQPERRQERGQGAGDAWDPLPLPEGK